MIEELHAIFKGRVQGVNFRSTVSHHAKRFELKGTVKNLKDGSVELYAVGERNILDTFLKEIQNESGMARIDLVETEYLTKKQSYPDFKIIH